MARLPLSTWEGLIISEQATKAKPNLSNPVHLLAFGLGSGVAPKAPGTFGTLAAVPLYYLLQDMAAVSYLLVLTAMFVMGVWLCDKTSNDLGVHDHGGIVWDEWVGFLLTMWLAPHGWEWVLLGFLLFRVFDIFKPWPIGWLDEKVSGGLGIMLDDVVAGLYALVLLQLTVYLVL